MKKRFLLSLLMVSLLSSCDNNVKPSLSDSTSAIPSNIETISPSESKPISSPSITESVPSNSSTITPSSPSDPSINQSSTTITLPEVPVKDVKAYNEMISIELESNECPYTISLKKKEESLFKNVDVEFNKENDTLKGIITGISKGTYQLKVSTTIDNKQVEKIIEDIEVSALDRSGYAHFDVLEGIGAYNNDGTLKDNVVVLNLNNENKNTIEATFNGSKYVGIAKILSNVSKSKNPVLIKVSGRISTNQWNYKLVEPRLADNSNLSSTHFENTFSSEYGENIEGLTLKCNDKKDGVSYQFVTTKTGIVSKNNGSTGKSTTTYSKSTFPNIQGKKVYDDDCNYNCLSISNAKNLTIEGVTPDAEFFQWGLSFSSAKSIEIKNLTFTDYPEDALAFTSESTTLNGSERIFVHNNVFNRGKNNWDLTGEQDKYAGDGALDMAKVSNVTASYNNFNNCQKTGLVGNSDSSWCSNITFHHNYYNKVGSRLPLSRRSNIHIYNNYYYQCGSALSIRTNGYVFSEYNYFEDTTNCHQVDKAVIKSYNDVFDNSKTIKSIKVSKRDELVANSCVILEKDFSSFDTNSDLFYYDATSKVSDVMILNKTDSLREFVKKYSGINGVYTRLPLTNNEELNKQIYGEKEVEIKPEQETLSFDKSDVISGTVIEENSFLQVGDFKVYYGFDVATSSGQIIFKNLGSDFASKKGLIEFNSKSNTSITVLFASRNSSATDRHLIIYSSTGKVLFNSHCANGSEKTTYTFEVEPNTTYYIGSNQGLTFYDIY